ncbi:carbohydrate-binding module family 50 protein [Macrolepiota fuliginosa MF-IS2]|uniref:Carbohydrate-binding module family 50 protein n=1 Tax=Macrolepiota fuliginosa MF-IS2 TaxID=1400762 RepID=A0A9P6BYY3_9AGAR|nr:carbohydrate-binding module family 50 protein [Macrolepiota fuliginosa MF-IS2]
MPSKLSLVTATLAAIFASTAPAQIPANCSRMYEVVADDTCDIISAAQNVSTFQLAHVNAAVINPDCTNLWVGEVTICLGLNGQDCTSTHKIVSGDSCWDIFVTEGIDLATLLANNPNVDNACSNIYPDEVICTASEVIAYDP